MLYCGIHTDWESFETEALKPKASKFSSSSSSNNGIYNRRSRSRKTEFEFPDGDLILTSKEVETSGDHHSRLLKIGPCTCWNTTSDMMGREVECKCSQSNFTQLVGTQLPSDVHRL